MEKTYRLLFVSCCLSLCLLLPSETAKGDVTRVNVRLWDQQNLHVTTRPHNRKIVYHAPTGNLFAFFGAGNATRDNRYRISRDGLNWSDASVAISGNGNSSSMDYLLAGDTIYAIFFAPAGTANTNYMITSFSIANDALIRGSSYVVVPSSTETTFFYGSLARDTSGYFWVGSRRQFQGETGIQTACVSRSARPNDISEWLPAVEVSPPNDKGNAVPDVVALDNGRLLAVSFLGMNYWIYPNGIGAIHAALYDPVKGWSPSYAVSSCNNSIRPVAEYDPSSNRVHLLYGDVTGDVRHRILQAPFEQKDWSAPPGDHVELGVDDKSGPEFDLSFGLDHRTTPAGLWAACLQKGRYNLHYYNGRIWEATPYVLAPPGSTIQNEVSMLQDVTHHIGMLYIDDQYVTYGEIFPSRPALSPTRTPTPPPAVTATPAAGAHLHFSDLSGTRL